MEEQEIINLLLSRDKKYIEKAFESCTRINDYSDTLSNLLQKHPILCARYNLENQYVHTLTELRLKNENFKEFPKEVFQFISLEVLDIKKCDIGVLPPDIGKLKKIRKIAILDSNLSKIPPEIEELKELKELYVESTNLTELPEEIWNLENLSDISLAANKLNNLSPHIARLKGLKDLSIDFNPISELPEEIWTLHNLNALTFSYTHITELSPKIAQLIHLKELGMLSVPLSSLPTEICNLVNLEELYLCMETSMSGFLPKIKQLENLFMLTISEKMLTIEEQKYLEELLPDCDIEVIEGGCENFFSAVSGNL